MKIGVAVQIEIGHVKSYVPIVQVYRANTVTWIILIGQITRSHASFSTAVFLLPISGANSDLLTYLVIQHFIRLWRKRFEQFGQSNFDLPMRYIVNDETIAV